VQEAQNLLVPMIQEVLSWLVQRAQMMLVLRNSLALNWQVQMTLEDLLVLTMQE
jgi:hypothetical protein